MKFYNRNQRHFRGHRTVSNGKQKFHPSYVVGESNDKYYSFGLTHDEYKGKKHKNHRLSSNPNPNDKYSSYLRKQLTDDLKSNYTKDKWCDLKMSKIDEEYVEGLINKRKNKKKK